VLRVMDEASPGATRSDAVARPILLYDGVCGLCNRFVQFILLRDPGGVFRFASLQSGLAGRVLARHGADPRDLDTVYIVVDYELPGERVVGRSDSVIFVLKQLAAAAELRSARTGEAPVPTQAGSARVGSASGAAFWRLGAFVLELVPRRLRDWGYGVVARNRYRVFGRYETCLLPAPENRGRFLDL